MGIKKDIMEELVDKKTKKDTYEITTLTLSQIHDFEADNKGFYKEHKNKKFVMIEDLNKVILKIQKRYFSAKDVEKLLYEFGCKIRDGALLMPTLHKYKRRLSGKKPTEEKCFKQKKYF